MNQFNNIRELIKDALHQFDIHYEEITANSNDDGKTIVLAKKNCPIQFEEFIQFIAQQGFRYKSYFCPTRERIKIDVCL